MIYHGHDEPLSFEKALFQLVNDFLRYDFKIFRYQSIKGVKGFLTINAPRGHGRYLLTTFTSEGYDRKNEFEQILQLIQAMLGSGMDDISTHGNLRDPKVWDKIQGLKGENKIRAILACMGGVPWDIATTMVARDYETDDVIRAYALHDSDPSVSMHELMAWNYQE